MKKNDLRLFLIFGVLLCSLIFAGCNTAEQGSGETTEQKTQESTESEITTEERIQTTETEEKTTETAEQTTESEITTEETTEQTTELEEPTETETEEIVEKNFGLENDLILEIKDFLRDYWQDVDPIVKTFEDKINDIKAGKQAIRVTFDPEAYYYACAYYNPTHLEEYPIEYPGCCCLDEYTWVKFEKENEIPEYYEGEKFVIALQVNKTSICQNILENDTSELSVEHFQIYMPEFQNEVNISAPLVYNESFIYLTSSQKSKAYFTSQSVYIDLNVFDCVVLNDECYLTRLLYSVHTSGSNSVTWSNIDLRLQKDFGAYYDDLIKVMLVGKYSESVDNGTSQYNRPYILFEIEDIVEIILE